ncbi:MAG: hypothetical protein JNK64_31420 [Myxococcales bacterium]|nr:hypothetical protein [Myxococcales bacterium]
MHRTLIALVLAGIGCGTPPPTAATDASDADATTPTDATPTDARPTDATPTDAADGAVVGRSYYRAATAGGFVDYPIDLSTRPVRAYVPDGTTAGYQVVPGVGRADGTFEIVGVPPGVTYMLAIGTDYYVTDQRALDRHFSRPGRPDTPKVTQPTPVTFALTNLSALPIGYYPDVFDVITVSSFGAAFDLGFASPFDAPTLDTTKDWRTGYSLVYPGGPPLPTGDDLHIFHARDDAVAIAGGRKASVRTLLDWFDAGTVTLLDGAPATVSGAFVHVQAPVTHSLSVQGWDRAAYDTAYGGASIGGYGVALIASPFPNTLGLGADLAAIGFSDWSRSTALTASLVVPYADPFPASWSRMLVDGYANFRQFSVPGAASSMYVAGGFKRFRLRPAGPPDLAPGLLLPTDVRINGVDAAPGGRLTFDGTRPVEVRWTAAAGATQYTVHVVQMSLNGTRTKATVLADVTTTATSIVIPAETFANATFVAFSLTAIQSTNAYASGVLVENDLPLTTATAIGGMFRLGTTCGDGQVDTGEVCDTTSASATCDVDCTPVRCGDGLANAAAGEDCDTTNDTLACDRDCTLAACGDGHINRTREDCDDGDAIDSGDGCSAACKFNNVCGDGVVQAAVEDCDAGGDTAQCDADCTFAGCGDGYRNAAAGEQCDFEIHNGVASPCSSSCQLQ